MSSDLGQPRIVDHTPVSRNAQATWDRKHRCFIYRTACTCGWSAQWTQDDQRPTDAHFAAHAAAEAATLAAQQVAWYERTGHCGQCGEPGVFCLCRQPCGCHELHEVGSGLVADALDTFAVVAVGDDQGQLFDSGGTQ